MSYSLLPSFSPAALIRMRTWWYILRTSMAERLTYRGDFAFATLVRFLPIVTQIFLWRAVFGVASDKPVEAIHRYTYASMIAYYLLANVGRAFSSMPGLAAGIAKEVRDGTVKRYLTQPVDMLGYLFWARLAHKLVYYTIAIIPFGIVFWLCRSFFEQSPDALTIAGFIVSLVLAFLIGFLMETLIGLSAFWFLEVNSLIFVFMMLNYFLSGHMIPLDYIRVYLTDTAGLPHWFAGVFDVLPFQYLAYFPAAVMLNRYTHQQLAMHLAIALGWTIALVILNRVMFARGLRRYSAYGG